MICDRQLSPYRKIVGVGAAQEAEAVGKDLENALGVKRTVAFDLCLQDLVDQRARNIIRPSVPSADISAVSSSRCSEKSVRTGSNPDNIF